MTIYNIVYDDVLCNSVCNFSHLIVRKPGPISLKYRLRDINRYLVDNCSQNKLCYLIDSDLSGPYRCTCNPLSNGGQLLALSEFIVLYLRYVLLFYHGK